MDYNPNTTENSKPAHDILLEDVVKTEKWDTEEEDEEEEDNTDMDWKQEPEYGQSDISSDASSQLYTSGILNNINNNHNNNLSSYLCMDRENIIEVECKKCRNNFTSLKTLLDHFHKAAGNNSPFKENHHQPTSSSTPKIIAVSSVSNESNSNAKIKLPLKLPSENNNTSECDPDPDIEPQSDPLELPDLSAASVPKFPFKCAGCDLGFRGKGVYDLHMNKRIERTKCPVSSSCPMTFTMNCAMLKHARDHREEAEEFATRANTQTAAPKTYGKKSRPTPDPSSSTSEARKSVSMVSIGIQVGIPTPTANGFNSSKKPTTSINPTNFSHGAENSSNNNQTIQSASTSKIIDDGRFWCDRPNCLKSFKKQEYLDKHIKEHMLNEDNIVYKKFRCNRPRCIQSFDDEPSLTEHFNAHLLHEKNLLRAKKVTCYHPGCGKVFTRKKGRKIIAFVEHLEFHQRGDQPVKCTKNPSFCSAEFDSERQLATHLRFCKVSDNKNTDKIPAVSKVLEAHEVRVSPRASKGKIEVYAPDNQGRQHVHKSRVPRPIGRPRKSDPRVTDCFVALSKNIIMDIDSSQDQNQDSDNNDDDDDDDGDRNVYSPDFDDIQNQDQVTDNAEDNNSASNLEDNMDKIEDKDRIEDNESVLSSKVKINVNSKKKVKKVKKLCQNSKVVKCPVCPGNVYCAGPLTLESHMKKRHGPDQGDQGQGHTELPPPPPKGRKKPNVLIPCNCRYPDCDVKLRSRVELSQHYRTVHGGKTPPVPLVPCGYEGCGKFIRNTPRLISIHIKRMHTREKDFLCNECGATFFNLSHLKRHEISHTNYRPFKCTWTNCEAAFKFAIGLRNHMLVHTNAKNYLCSHCARTFKKSDALNVHLRLHSDEKRFKCPICTDIGYNHKVTLKSHMQKSHPDFEGQL